MTKRPHLTCHCDEAMALREELALQTEISEAFSQSLRAEVTRLEKDKAQLQTNVAFWRRQAELAEGRAREERRALLAALSRPDLIAKLS